MRQTFDVLVETVAVERLDRPDNPGVEGAPTLLQEAAVGHLVGERVLERVGRIREHPRLVQELGGLEPGETGGQYVGGSASDGGEHSHRDVRADDRRRLQEVLVF